MKKLALTTSILLSVGIEIIAQPISYLPNQNTFQPVINPQKMRNWNDEMRTVDLYKPNDGKVIYNVDHLPIELHESTSDSSKAESIHIKKQIK